MTQTSFVARRLPYSRSGSNRCVIAALVAVLSLTACGGGGDGSTEPPVPTVSSITVTPGSLALLTGTTGSLAATVSPAGASSAMTWSSDAPSVATVSGSGSSATVTAVASGTATIRATSSSNTAVSGSVVVTVSAPVVATLTLSSTSHTLVPSQPVSVTATARDAAGATIANPTMTWTSSASAVASVGSDGRITGVTPGTAIITARSGNATANANVTVNDGGYVSATGGTITALGGTLVIEVPVGSVTTPTAFTVRRVANAPAHARLLGGTAVEIETSAALVSPPTLRLAYPAVLAADVVETQLRLARVNNASWQESAVETVNRTTRLVAASMSSTGTWAVFVPPPSLRSYSQLRGIEIGGAVNIQELRDADIRRVLAAEFNTTTPGNEMKWSSTHPAPNTYTFVQADSIVNFALANGMRIHGHTLLWHNQAPAWVQAATQTRTTLLAALKGHIETIVPRYAGRATTWDVVNEVISENQTGLRSSFWVNIGGADIIDSAFVWARRADPTAKLYINDFAVEGINAKSDSLLAFAVRRKARGVPIDGIGLQAHFGVVAPTFASMKANIDRIAAAGFDIRITELDVRLADGTDNLATQATIYANTMEACRAQPRCKAVTIWGVSDKHSWIPTTFPGFGRGLPFDVNFLPKPAYTSLRDVLARP